MDTKDKEHFRDQIWAACSALNDMADEPLSSDDLMKAIRTPMIAIERAVTKETFWGTKLEAISG